MDDRVAVREGAAAAVLAILVGFYLVRSVMAADEGTPKMKEIASAKQCLGQSLRLGQPFLPYI